MKRYTRLWRVTKLLTPAKTFDELIGGLQGLIAELQLMKKDEITFKPIGDECYLLSTQNEEIAKRFRMTEHEFFEKIEEEEFTVEPEYGGESGV